MLLSCWARENQWLTASKQHLKKCASSSWAREVQGKCSDIFCMSSNTWKYWKQKIKKPLVEGRRIKVSDMPAPSPLQPLPSGCSLHNIKNRKYSCTFENWKSWSLNMIRKRQSHDRGGRIFVWACKGSASSVMLLCSMQCALLPCCCKGASFSFFRSRWKQKLRVALEKNTAQHALIRIADPA